MPAQCFLPDGALVKADAGRAKDACGREGAGVSQVFDHSSAHRVAQQEYLWQTNDLLF